MLTKVIVSVFLGAVAVAMAACGGNNTTTISDGCVGHTCAGGPGPKVTDPDGGSIIFEYITFDTELQALGYPPTANRIMAFFMDGQTPESNPLPVAGQCNNLVATNGWPIAVGSPHTDLDVGTLTIKGKNTAGADVTIDVPKKPKGTDNIGRPHDIFYEIVQPDAAAYLQRNSAYSITFGGAGTIPNATFADGVTNGNGLFLAEAITVNSPTLEENGPLVGGTDFTVKWTPSTSSNLPAAAQLIGGDVLGVAWLVDTKGSPTHMCPTLLPTGQMTIPGSAINEYKAIAQARSLPTDKAILLRAAIVHQVARLPNNEATNQRRVDMLTLECKAQLMDVQ
jgi:hypothetical protein